MYTEEKIQGNKVNTPILFVGLGGKGSQIIQSVAARCANDDTSNIRFVVLDTDVNDLLKVNKGAEVVAIQTSSTATVETYLRNNPKAKRWFPGNRMLNDKVVSEGAGQVRAISRLALNDIVKNGRIRRLYEAIDDLFLKDGSNYNQAVRVVLASTAAGGTGSGIVMKVAMLIRHYLKTQYPNAAVMIRGLLLLPGVMDTVIDTRGEQESLRCNGYATIKEINAFMMKGSGFFETEPLLKRYQDLCVTIPGTSPDKEEDITGLPFDFCFLIDRIDEDSRNMKSLDSYVEFAAQSLYEQNIGPMSLPSSSMEDNVRKLCYSPEKLGRCRFGSVGSSVLRYPYTDIRDYIALNWTRASIIGSSADSKLTEEQRKELLERSWLQYDVKFRDEYRAWEENPNASGRNEPTRAGVYMSCMEAGADLGSGNDFTMSLWEKYLKPKIAQMGDEVEERTIAVVAKHYIDTLVKGVAAGQLEREYGFESNIRRASSSADKSIRNSFTRRYNAITAICDNVKERHFTEIARSFAREVFTSRSSASKEDLGEYMLERFLSVNGKMMHPNAARYLLYCLDVAMTERIQECTSFLDTIEDKIRRHTELDHDDTDKYEVLLHFGKENSLRKMCSAVDSLGAVAGAIGDPHERCDDLLRLYYEEVARPFFEKKIAKEICDIASARIKSLIESYERFYNSFELRIPEIEKKKEDIVGRLRFKNGDYVYNIFGSKNQLDRLTQRAGRPTDSGEDTVKLYARIFESLRANAYIEARRQANPYAYEQTVDIFNDIILEYYKNRVDSTCEFIQVKNVLEGLILEHEINVGMELDELPEDRREQKLRELGSEAALMKFLNSTIEKCHNLASPGLKKADSEEPRTVDVVACASGVEDAKGIRVSDLLKNVVFSSSISRYELHFFRAIYNIEPNQLAKFRAPKYTDEWDEFSLAEEQGGCSAGDYFQIYQQYMDRIGPDSRTSPVITPHIDASWNAISKLPEMDMQYQRRLMRKIHKAMFYGFLYGRLCLRRASEENPDERIYKYLDKDENLVELRVSNRTRCDELYEVMDALYFDRAAVATVCRYVGECRQEAKERGIRKFDDLEFCKKTEEFRFKMFTGISSLRESDDKASLFTLILMYCNSLPAHNVDTEEMKAMIEAVIEMVYSEMLLCQPDEDSLDGPVATFLVDQFNLLLNNYKDHTDELRRSMLSDNVVSTVRRTLVSFFRSNMNNIRNHQTELNGYIGDLEAFEED